MDRKTIFLIIPCVLLLLLWGSIMDWIWPHKPSTVSYGANGTNHVSVTQLTNLTPLPTSPLSTPYTGVLSFLSKTNTLVPSQTATLESDRFRVKFTNLGGGIENVFLKQFTRNGTGNVLLNDQSPFPVMSIAIGDIAFRAPYQWTVSSNQVHAVYQSPMGLQVSKEYTLKSDYQISTQVVLKNVGHTALNNATLDVALGMAGPLNSEDKGQYIGLSFFSQEKAFHENVVGLKKQVEKQQKPFEKAVPLDWAAVKNQYFTIVLTPSVPFAAIQAEPYPLSFSEDPHAVKNQNGMVAIIRSPAFNLPEGASTNWTFALYTGPKEYKLLSALGQHQDDVLEFGPFKIFSSVLLWTLTVFHGVFHNWGIAIIAVTIFIKILCWPLTAMSTKSMKQMQALAPKLNTLKEKYKDDPQKLNEETMKMYREYRINPMAGCLPMLIQIPIFIAFYNMLRTAIELRGASFLWIHDLSMPDTVVTVPGFDLPINLMPLIMVVTMIWQTKMTPQAPNADPSMKIMMWFMPAMFLFFCYNYSSGLSLYWTVQNLLTVLQTYLTRNKPVEPPQKLKTRGGFTFSRPIETKKK